MDLGIFMLFSVVSCVFSVLDWVKCLEKELHNLDWITRPLAENVLCSSPVY